MLHAQLASVGPVFAVATDRVPRVHEEVPREREGEREPTGYNADVAGWPRTRATISAS